MRYWHCICVFTCLCPPLSCNFHDRRDHVYSIYHLHPVLSIASDWHIVHAQYMCIIEQWVNHCPLFFLLEVWARGPQLNRVEWGRNMELVALVSGSERGLRDLGTGGVSITSQPLLSRLLVPAAYFPCLWESEIRLGWIYSYHSAAQ